MIYWSVLKSSHGSAARMMIPEMVRPSGTVHQLNLDWRYLVVTIASQTTAGKGPLNPGANLNVLLQGYYWLDDNGAPSEGAAIQIVR